MIFDSPAPINRPESERKLSSDEPDEIIDALLRSAYYDSDWRWVQDLCLKYLSYSNRDVQYMALLCLGHIARIHRVIDKDKVLPSVEKFLNNPRLGQTAENTLQDIEIFVR